MSDRFKTYVCENCNRDCRTRIAHPTRTQPRLSGRSPEMWCLRCTDAERQRAGGPPPAPSTAKIRRDDAARNLKLWGGRFNEAK